MYCNVLVTKPFDQTFTYLLKFKKKAKVGSVVLVSFGKHKNQVGIIYEFIKNPPQNIKKNQIKEIDFVFDKIILNKKIIQFINWISNYTLSPKGGVLKLFLINKNILNKKEEINKKQIFFPNKIKLNPEQKNAYNLISKHLISKFKTIVLEGVTGSGKTEVYFESIKKVLGQKKQILIMVPEISLTPQLEERFIKNFNLEPNIWHSKINDNKKIKTWHQCFNGFPTIVIGARSSLFIPFSNLGLIIVDEEHDLSYKQEDNIRYHARDLAIVRAKIEKIPVILSSATPSLETCNNIKNKKFEHVYLSKQYSNLELPDIELIDLKNENLDKDKWISNKLISEIKSCIKKGNQALLFLNRRGYSPLSLCKDCGYRYQCEYCSSWLVFHKKKKKLLCHQCGSIYDIKINCSSCNKKNSLKLVGPGVERLEEEVKNIFPTNNISVMSSDNANTPNKIKNIINDFEKNKINILVATQIMAKGYHFPNLSLVGIIDADAGLVGGDLRAIERTYNLLQQVSGRAGRSQAKGKVLIQTYYPDQPIIQSIKNRDRKSFVNQTLKEREQFKMPPFCYMNAIIISSSSKVKAQYYAEKIVKNTNLTNNINILGPVEAPLFLLRGQYRFRILIKGEKRQILNNFTKNIFVNFPPPSHIRLIIDVDPYTFV